MYLNEKTNKYKKTSGYFNFVDNVLKEYDKKSIFDIAEISGNPTGFPDYSKELYDKNIYFSEILSKDLDSYLRESYIENDFKTIKPFTNMKEKLNFFSPYFIKTNKYFGSIKEVVPFSDLYNTLSFDLYQALCKIYPDIEKNKDLFQIYTILETDNLYKIGVKLPKYVSLATLTSYINIIEEQFSLDTRKKEVPNINVVKKTHLDVYLFEITKVLKESVPFSIADVLYKDINSPFLELQEDSYAKPIILGQDIEENPIIIDALDKKNFSIIGEKTSQITYNIVNNLVLFNSFEDLNIILCVEKDNIYWNTFKNFPHVLGYHTTYEDIYKVVSDIHDESVRRVKACKRYKKENIKELKGKIDYTADVFLVLDNISSLLQNSKILYDNKYEQKYYLLQDMLMDIVENSSKTDIGIIGTSEKSDFLNFPLNMLEKDCVVITLKNTSEKDYFNIFGNNVDRYNIYTNNEAVIQRFGFPEYCKTCFLMGGEPRKSLAVLRAQSFECLRRSTYSDETLVENPKGSYYIFAVNRQLYMKDVLEKVVNDKIILDW